MTISAPTSTRNWGIPIKVKGMTTHRTLVDLHCVVSSSEEAVATEFEKIVLWLKDAAYKPPISNGSLERAYSFKVQIDSHMGARLFSVCEFIIALSAAEIEAKLQGYTNKYWFLLEDLHYSLTPLGSPVFNKTLEQITEQKMESGE